MTGSGRSTAEPRTAPGAGTAVVEPPEPAQPAPPAPTPPPAPPARPAPSTPAARAPLDATQPAVPPPGATRAETSAGAGLSATLAAAVEQVLFALPIGSVLFADEVAKRLWRQPAAADLKALAIIVEGLARTPAGPYRDLISRAVALRQRMERLLAIASPSGRADPAQRATLGTEWWRVARLVGETRIELDSLIAGREEPILRAAATLLPDPADVQAEATLAGEAQQLLDPDSRENPETLEVPHARDLIDALRGGTAQDDDPLFLDMLACWTLARRAVRSGDERQLELGRRIVARVSARADAVIARHASQHRRDPEGNARLASWRRFLLDARSRLDEALTAGCGPPPESNPAGQVPPASGPEGSVHHPRMRQKGHGKAGADASAPAEPEGTPDPPRLGLFGWLKSRVRS